MAGGADLEFEQDVETVKAGGKAIAAEVGKVAVEAEAGPVVAAIAGPKIEEAAHELVESAADVLMPILENDRGLVSQIADALEGANLASSGDFTPQWVAGGVPEEGALDGILPAGDYRSGDRYELFANSAGRDGFSEGALIRDNGDETYSVFHVDDQQFNQLTSQRALEPQSPEVRHTETMELPSATPEMSLSEPVELGLEL